MGDRPEGLNFISRGTSTEVYQFVDYYGGDWVRFQVHDDGTIEINTDGEPEVLPEVFRWIADRADELKGGI